MKRIFLFSFLIIFLVIFSILISAVGGSFEIEGNGSEPPIGDGRTIEEDELLIKTIGSCIPDWDCGNWTDCKDFIRTRECSDKIRCGIPPFKIDRQLCIPPIADIEKFLKEEPVKNYPWWLIFLLILLILIIILIILIRELKKKNRYRKRLP